MKRFTALLLVVVLLVCSCSAAFAAQDGKAQLLIACKPQSTAIASAELRAITMVAAMLELATVFDVKA